MARLRGTAREAEEPARRARLGAAQPEVPRRHAAHLRALAAGGDGAAHVALARFRIAKDLPLLTAWLSRPSAFDDATAFLAAQQFPDASLVPALIALEPRARAKIAEGLPHRLRKWFGAFAAQRSAGATAFLVRILQQTPPGGAGAAPAGR